ncbi:MAG: hypothetical protein FWF82_07390, partial [Oscillospiraceae bacterium]|nr:hypothetical protein [Oscillospiraceae bacterium]
SDDWIESDMYEVLYKSLYKDKNADISVVSFFKEYESGQVRTVNEGVITQGIIPTRDMILYALKRDDYAGFTSYVWNKLYTADLIRKSGLRFDESIKYGMDVLFYYSLVIPNKCVGVYTGRRLYHYLQRGDAISKTNSPDLKTDILIGYKRAEELMNSNGFSDISYYARGFYCYHAGEAAEVAHKSGDTAILLRMREEIKSHFDDYARTNRNNPEKIERMYRTLEYGLSDRYSYNLG